MKHKFLVTISTVLTFALLVACGDDLGPHGKPTDLAAPIRLAVVVDLSGSTTKRAQVGQADLLPGASAVVERGGEMLVIPILGEPHQPLRFALPPLPACAGSVFEKAQCQASRKHKIEPRRQMFEEFAQKLTAMLEQPRADRSDVDSALATARDFAQERPTPVHILIASDLVDNVGRKELFPKFPQHATVAVTCVGEISDLPLTVKRYATFGAALQAVLSQQ